MKQYLHKHIFLVLLVVAVHVLFGMLACYYQRIYMGDSFEYVYEALHIVQKGWLYSGNSALPIQAEYLTQRPPLYPLLLSAIYLIGGTNWWMLIAQNLLSIFNILYVHHLFISKLKPAMQYVFILLILGYPSQFIQANTIAPELVLQTCFLLYIGNLTHWFNTKNIKHIYAMCLWLVLGFCTKPVLYPFAFLHLLIIPLLMLKKHHWMHIAVASTLPLMGVIAYSSYNYARTGKYHFSSNQAFNALYYYKPFLASTKSEAVAQQFLDTTRRRIDALPTFAQRYDAANHIGQDMLQQNFAPYLLFHLKYSFRLLIEPGKAELDLFTGHLTYGRLYQPIGSSLAEQWAKNGIAGLPQYIRQNPSFFWAMLILSINCLRLIGLWLLIRAFNRQHLLWILLLACILYFMLITGPIANTRYFLPISLIAIALSTLGYNQWYTKKIYCMNKIAVRTLLASWLPSVAMLICALAILYPFCSYYIDPDGTAYLTISQRYASGDYSTAINGYWSPWSCWLTALLMKAGLSAVPASWAVNALGAIGVLCSTLILLKQHSIDSFTQKIMQIGLICFLANAVYIQSFDDLWETFFIVCMLLVAHQLSQQHKTIYWVAMGVLGALAYFAKAYALPYFVLLSIFIAYTLYKNQKPLALKMLLLAWSICAMISAPWWWLLHQKYGFFTTSTAGSLNLSWYLVGHPLFKDNIHVFIPPAYAGSPYYWEDPWLANGALPRLWDNSQLFVRQLLKLGYNGLLFLLSMAQLSLFSLWLLYKILLLAIRRHQWRSLPRTQQLLVGAIVLFPSGYWLINFEARYLWPIMPLSIVLMLKWLHKSLLPRLGAQYVLGVLLLLSVSFALYPVYLIRTIWNVGQQEARIAHHLQSLPEGGFTGNAHPQAMARIAYWWHHPYYYIAKKEATPAQVSADAQRWPIQYYLYFNNPPVKRMATTECLLAGATLISQYCYAPQDTLYIYQLKGTFKE